MRVTRRSAFAAVAAGSLAACGAEDAPSRPSAPQTALPTPSSSLASAWRMPDEDERHERTWMAFGVASPVWDEGVVATVRENLALVANTISEFEPVSLLVRPDQMSLAKSLVSAKVKLAAAELDDLWIRDTGCTFVADGAGKRAGISFNFNGWGNKQVHAQDARVAAVVAREAGVPLITAPLVLEGGCLETDGHGLAVLTESCVLNDNRNPGVSKAEFEARLAPLLGIKKFLWLPGIAGRDITDGHVDFYARFAGGRLLVGKETDPQSYDKAVTDRHLELLAGATDLAGRPIPVTPLKAPTHVRPKFASKDFAAGYVGYYVCNGAVIAQEFGDPEADAAAQQALASAYPGRSIVPLNVDGIASGGGSIHCATQQEIAAS